MNRFLKDAKSLLPLKDPILAVIGNESCDLDSVISSICLAFFIFKNKKSSALPASQPTNNVLPIINIPRVKLPLKTEVIHLLKKHEIDVDNLICKDEANLPLLVKENRIKFVLVDHHVSSLRDLVVSVVDHRPFDENCNLPADCQKYINEVGSCATLVADIIRKDVNLEASEDFNTIFKMLHTTIVLDTINFSKEADKAKPLDYEIVQLIENLLKIEDVQNHRKQLFDELVKARADVSSLNSLQILSKDLKIIANSSNSVRIAIPGYPISVQEYIKLPDAEKNVKTFAESNNIDVVFLMGMKCSGNSVKRDMGIIDIKNPELFQQIISAITTSKSPDLLLKQHENVHFLKGQFFDQLNIKASRKQILPLLKNILDQRI